MTTEKLRLALSKKRLTNHHQGNHSYSVSTYREWLSINKLIKERRLDMRDWPLGTTKYGGN